MKCKFDRKTIYGNQVFLPGQTYELSNRDAAALGCVKGKAEATETVEVPEAETEKSEVTETKKSKK